MAIAPDPQEHIKVHEFLKAFVDRANVMQDRLGTDLKVHVPDDTRLFGLGQTEAQLASEILLFCLPPWSKLLVDSPPQMIERVRGEVHNRIRSILAQQFISTMSLIEFSAKESIKAAPDPSLAATVASNKKRRVSLRVIVEESRGLNLISGTDLQTWLALIEIRNMMVHNNGIADTSATYEIAGLTVDLVPGKMTETDTFLFFPKITAGAVFKYHEWLRSLFGVREDRSGSSQGGTAPTL